MTVHPPPPGRVCGVATLSTPGRRIPFPVAFERVVKDLHRRAADAGGNVSGRLHVGVTRIEGCAMLHAHASTWTPITDEVVPA